MFHLISSHYRFNCQHLIGRTGILTGIYNTCEKCFT